MNEIEVQKLLVKEAFSKAKPIPDFGGIGDENSLKLRNYIWKVCGYIEEETMKPKKAGAAATVDAKANTAVVQSKKNALVVLYRLWSAFSKNMRYIIASKGNSVSL